MSSMCSLAWCYSRFLPAAPGAATRCGMQLQPAASLEQVEAIRSGLLDAGSLDFMPKADAELDQLLVATQHVELAAPKRHPLTKLKKFRLRDPTDVPFSGSQGTETRCSTTA